MGGLWLQRCSTMEWSLLIVACAFCRTIAASSDLSFAVNNASKFAFNRMPVIENYYLIRILNGREPVSDGNSGTMIRLSSAYRLSSFVIVKSLSIHRNNSIHHVKLRYKRPRPAPPTTAQCLEKRNRVSCALRFHLDKSECRLQISLLRIE